MPEFEIEWDSTRSSIITYKTTIDAEDEEEARRVWEKEGPVGIEVAERDGDSWNDEDEIISITHIGPLLDSKE